ncbi:hypothetical protein HYALB_00007049 [Hymenoscyphus albidus]|uniref:NAD(P)-binding protein n=1 Tax=Hymenoscyphus albidus TaxID=595503 RepID=A0A9N9LQW4_9HELO|nr:hypothetical protein HYALB_00007049 [Hymenoscyphus albidus]
MSNYDTELKDFPSTVSLKGKLVVITGGSRGLGLHAASGILQAGAQKVFKTSRKALACAQAVSLLNNLPNLAPGAKAIAVPADISTIARIQGLVKQVGELTEYVDVLVANAGASWGERFEDHSDGAFGKVMDLNVRGVFGCLRLFAPLLQKRGTIADPSRVIITASVAGLAIGTLGPHATYAYSASKAAAIHLSKNLAVELGPRHILVNAIAPGLFPTKMANGLIDLCGGLEETAKRNPSGRNGVPEDIAGLVVFLSSRAGSHANGAVVTVDGGEYLISGSLGGMFGAGKGESKI